MEPEIHVDIYEIKNFYPCTKIYNFSSSLCDQK